MAGALVSLAGSEVVLAAVAGAAMVAQLEQQWPSHEGHGQSQPYSLIQTGAGVRIAGVAIAGVAIVAEGIACEVWPLPGH